MTDKAYLRQRELDRQARKVTHVRVPSPFTTKVVGVTNVKGYPDNLRKLYGAMEAEPDGVFTVDLLRQPRNQYDPNAIEVRIFGKPVGFIVRPLAARLAPQIDAGERWVGRVSGVLVVDGNWSQPGVEITVEREE